ncbi:MAG: hypothetical protein EXR61_05490 [Chloroflexi bacterium]|nr:hypothetical protein [Chloroflexota bacterium]
MTDEIEAAERVGRLQIALRPDAAALGGTLSHAEALLRDLRALHTSIISSLTTPAAAQDPAPDVRRELAASPAA